MSNASSSCFRLTLIVTVLPALSPLAQGRLHIQATLEVPPDLLTPGGTEIASHAGTILGVNGFPPFFTANYTTSVFSDPNNTFCSGCLDFTYGFTNNGPTVPIFDVGVFDFSGSPVVDVGYDPTTNGVIPASVDFTSGGISFNFRPATGGKV